MATDTTATVANHEHQREDWSGGKPPMDASYGKLMMWYFLLSDAFTFSGFLIAYGALRFSSPTWPIPDHVFQTLPFLGSGWPLIFVTFMTFVLIVSSVTMVRAVQEGHRENKAGVVKWMILTIIGGAAFLGCQAFEWTELIFHENMSLTQNPFSAHTENGVYLDGDKETFKIGDGYLIHSHDGDYAPRSYKTEAGEVKTEQLGPKAFGGLFFFITGFHGFHVFSGLVFLLIIAINVHSGLYVDRKNGYEMVEKVGLYWHFVDLVWVFVFLLFYLL